MIFEAKYKVAIDDIDKDGEATNRAILSYFEDIACAHSSSVGVGPLTVNEVGYGWVLLDWRVKVLKRPVYNEEVLVKTWSRGIQRIMAFRDFEIRNNENEVLAIATSRWVLIDINTRRPMRLTDELMKIYESEPDRKVFEEEFEKIDEVQEYKQKMDYIVGRRDIDMNNHMHNLNYLDLAYEMISEEAYESKLNNIVIEYRKEIKYGEKIECYYSENNNQNIVTIKTEDKTNAIIILS